MVATIDTTMHAPIGKKTRTAATVSAAIRMYFPGSTMASNVMM